MSATVLREQLIEHFPETETNEKLLQECISICQNYDTSGTELFYKWEAKRFGSGKLLGGGSAQELTMAAVEDLKKGIIEDLNKKRLKEQSAQNRKVDVMAMMRRGQQNNPKSIKAAAIGTAQNGAQQNVDMKVTFKGPTESRKKRKYRYMYEKVSERSEVLDERVDEFAELVREHYNIDELGDPSATSEENLVVVGRICNDADSSNSPSPKLTDGSIYLESSRMMSSGARVLLRFSHTVKLRGTTQGAGGLGLFPGAIVALMGRNGGGGFFAVDEILGLPPLKLSPDPPSYKAFTLVAASGPYTSDADIKFKQLDLLISKVLPLKPSVLLLSGPFIDTLHPIISSGDIEQTPSEIFNQEIAERLRSFLSSSPGTLVLLQPSIRDLLSDHPVFPQCELENVFLTDSHIKMLPNPCRFSINDVSFATTSVDVLFHLRNQEYLQRGQEIDSVPLPPEVSATDVLTNTCRHLLTQRSFYPLFPVPADLSAEVNLDVSHWDGLRLDASAQEHAPDVLIVPSRLKQFAKMVDAMWAINSSFATKGTFAMIAVSDTSQEDLRKKIKCEIIRI